MLDALLKPGSSTSAATLGFLEYDPPPLQTRMKADGACCDGKEVFDGLIAHFLQSPSFLHPCSIHHFFFESVHCLTGIPLPLLCLRSKIFVLLFICIIFLMWMTNFVNVHTYVFFGLAVCLYFSIKFFVRELRAVQAAEGNPETKKAN